MEYLKTQQGAGGEGEGEGGRRGEMMAELGASLRVAKQVAEEGSGGRKRRFDLGMWQGVPQGPKRVREGSGQRGSEHAVRGGGGRGGRGGGVRGGRIGIRSPHPLRLAPVQSQREVVRRRVDMADADVWRPSYK